MRKQLGMQFVCETDSTVYRVLVVFNEGLALLACLAVFTLSFLSSCTATAYAAKALSFAADSSSGGGPLSKYDANARFVQQREFKRSPRPLGDAR